MTDTAATYNPVCVDWYVPPTTSNPPAVVWTESPPLVWTFKEADRD